MRLLAEPERCVLGTIRQQMALLTGIAYVNGERDAQCIASGPNAILPALTALLSYEWLLERTLCAVAAVTAAAGLALSTSGDLVGPGTVGATYALLLAALTLPLHRRAAGTGWRRFLGQGHVQALKRACQPTLVAGAHSVYLGQAANSASAVQVTVVPYAELGAVALENAALVLRDRDGGLLGAIVDPVALKTVEDGQIYEPITLILADIHRRIADGARP